VQVPFTTAIGGGEVQLTVGRQTGKTDTITVKIPPGIEDGKKFASAARARQRRAAARRAIS